MSTQTVQQRKALSAYGAALCRTRFEKIEPQPFAGFHAADVRGADNEVRRSTAQPPSRPQAVRRRSLGHAVTVACEQFANHGWIVMLAIIFAAAILNARAQGVMP